MIKLIASGVGALVFFIFAFSTYYTIDQGERGVILHFGQVVGESEPGLHFKMPFVTSVEKISIQPQKISYDDKKAGAYLQAYSKDQQPADIELAVIYHVVDVTKLYSTYSTTENAEHVAIDPKIWEQVKNVFGGFDAVEAIQNRANLNAKAQAALQAQFSNQPFVIDSLQIEDISFSQGYENAVEARMQATVKQQQAEAEKAQRIINADAAAYEVKAKADAMAHQIEVQGNAEAAAIRARGDALRDNPNLVALTATEKWNGQLPSTMVPGSTVPFLNLQH